MLVLAVAVAVLVLVLVTRQEGGRGEDDFAPRAFFSDEELKVTTRCSGWD